jgi:hypothetical protein
LPSKFLALCPGGRQLYSKPVTLPKGKMDALQEILLVQQVTNAARMMV